ncbi:hypothetical protein QVD17_08035 [Tagetes erecta]|uniref:peptidylprolyl isomerase n=1 Tax=Tagetes erecta TaxID=13708 RepID=A0AAD8L5E0_TARER|nr:hypothetical protein QVD17_08035 [Tagetes erecta]
MSNHNLTLFDELRGKVSHKALDLLVYEIGKIKSMKENSATCSCRLYTDCGLPCACRLNKCKQAGIVIPLESIDPFWKKLDISPTYNEETTIIDVNRELERMKQQIIVEPEHVRKNIFDDIWGSILPWKTKKKEPVVKTNNRGRPRKDKQKAMDPPRYSSFENTDRVSTVIPGRHSSVVDMNEPLHTPSVHIYSGRHSVHGSMDHGRRDSFINVNSIPPQYDFFGMSQDVTQNSFVEPPKPVRQSTYEPGDEERFNFMRFAPYIPKVFHPYISRTVDVRGDGNCGFRSVAVGLGLPEHEWQFIRSELYQELTGRILTEIVEAIRTPNIRLGLSNTRVFNFQTCIFTFATSTMAFWGIELKPGKPYVHQYDDERGRLHVSQATLGNGKSKEKAVVVCNVGDKKPIYLCSLLPRKMETCSLNIEFEEYEEVTFSVEGPHNIHLSGFFFGEKPDSDEEECESDSDEDGSFEGVEIGSGDDSEFDFDDEDDLTDNEMDMFPSNVSNSGVKIEEIIEDEKPNENAVSEQSKKKNKKVTNNEGDAQKQLVSKSSSSAPVLESEDEDGFPISDKDNIPSGKKITEESIKKGEKGQAKRRNEVEDSENKAKRKKDDSAVSHDDSMSQPAIVEAATPETDAKKSKKKNKKAKVKQEGANVNSNEGLKEETNQEQTTEKVASSVKDKKKNKQQENTPVAKANESATEAKPTQVRTFPNGLVIEELQMGKPNGKRADPGKKISMRYIGKLKKNGKIFDSNIGKAPFKFRLGVGQVISGWDVGVKGMRVGDKRRLTIPPAMGYGAKGAGSAIPPNSWLVFDVELVDVN